ncbi:MAG: transcription elongation factor GreA [Saprospiraceae bacterium]|nr:transcription elongation factor GreA [Saprospiraceae bacterium]
MSKYTYFTQQGYDKVKSELDELKSVGRQEVAKAIAEAREKGDLSENAEYDAAKNAQGLLELKINELEKVLAIARVLSNDELDISVVTVLSTVSIKNLKLNKQLKYKLVSESEADIKANKISVNSPIGKGLLGKSVGDKATVTTPAGNLEFEILDISIE